MLIASSRPESDPRQATASALGDQKRTWFGQDYYVRLFECVDQSIVVRHKITNNSIGTPTSRFFYAHSDAQPTLPLDFSLRNP